MIYLTLFFVFLGDNYVVLGKQPNLFYPSCNLRKDIVYKIPHFVMNYFNLIYYVCWQQQQTILFLFPKQPNLFHLWP